MLTTTPCSPIPPVAADVVAFNCNGQQVEVGVDTLDTLAEVLREDLRLTGTKVGCGTGDCGSCTVIVDDQAVCSCLVLASRCEGRQVETIERLADTTIGAVVIDELARHHGVQCGICSPGLVVAAARLLADRDDLDTEAVQTALAGNLCRCTGYRPIVDAVMAASQRMQSLER